MFLLFCLSVRSAFAAVPLVDESFQEIASPHTLLAERNLENCDYALKFLQIISTDDLSSQKLLSTFYLHPSNLGKFLGGGAYVKVKSGDQEKEFQIWKKREVSIQPLWSFSANFKDLLTARDYKIVKIAFYADFIEDLGEGVPVTRLWLKNGNQDFELQADVQNLWDRNNSSLGTFSLNRGPQDHFFAKFRSCAF